MATYNEPQWACEGVLYETPEISREVVTVPSGTAAIGAMTVLGYVRTSAAVGADTAAGNGAFVADSVTATPAAQSGVYLLAALSATKMQVFAPDGSYLGLHTIGSAWSANGIGFSTQGTWAIGDAATITVTHTDAVGAYDATGPVIGVALYPVDASSAAATVTALVRLAAVQTAALQWAAGVDAGEKTAAIAQMAANNLYARS
jgi:hypothetical protein